MSAQALDPLIHVPARLQIMAALATLPDGDQLSFKRLQDMIELTPGNLITHLRKLEEAGYLATSKTGSGPASRTSVALSHDGRHALEIYATTLRGLLNGVSAGPTGASGSHLDRHGASPGPLRILGHPAESGQKRRSELGYVLAVSFKETHLGASRPNAQEMPWGPRANPTRGGGGHRTGGALERTHVAPSIHGCESWASGPQPALHRPATEYRCARRA